MVQNWAGLLMVACLAGISVAGCATKSSFGVWRPSEVDVNGIERLVVLDFEGPHDSGKIVRSALVAQLWENRFYTLVDQSELQRIRPIALSNGQPDIGGAVDAARSLGVDAVLTGQVVSYKAEDEKLESFHVDVAGGESKNKKSGNSTSGLGVGIDKTETLVREATVGIAFKLIDVRTGAIRAAHQLAHNFNGQSVNGNVKLPGKEQSLTELTGRCARDTIAMLAPHYVPNEVVLAKQYYGSGLSELRRGNSLAQKKNWSGAEAAWETALKQSRQNHAAMYNLALAAEARGDYATSIQRIEQAIDEYGDTLYHNFRKKLETNHTAYLAAMNQIQAKNSLLAARQAHGQSIPVNYNAAPVPPHPTTDAYRPPPTMNAPFPTYEPVPTPPAHSPSGPPANTPAPAW